MAKISGAQALFGQLRSEGVDTVFSLPGLQILAAYDALHDDSHFKLVQPYHEQTVAYMADGYARVTGKVGVGLVVPGPGALNAAAALGTAFASSSPVLLVSGQIPSGSLGRSEGQLHELDEQLDVFSTITKWNHRVTGAGEIPGAVHEAFRQLSTGRPRPVELEIPQDILAEMVDAEYVEPEEYPPKKGDPLQVQRAAQLLAGAQSPAILAGGGTMIAGASLELTELAEFLQAPVVTTSEAKGVISDDHSLAVGVSRYQPVNPLHSVLQKCDMLLAVGTRLLVSKEYGPLRSIPIVHLDVDPAVIGLNMPVEVGIEADARAGLARLLEELRKTAPPKESRLQEIEGLKQEFLRKVRKIAPDQMGMVDALRSELAEDAIIVSGINNCGYWTDLAFPVYQPRSYVTSSYFINLGYAFPTALGAKVAYPDRQVVAVSGDGGFMYCLPELATAVNFGINVVTVIFNNHAYQAILVNQRSQYGERNLGARLDNPDFVKVAESFGAVGMRTDPSGLAATLRRALDAKVPVVIDVETPLDIPPPWGLPMDIMTR